MPMLTWQIIITDDGGVAAADDRLQGQHIQGGHSDADESVGGLK